MADNINNVEKVGIATKKTYDNGLVAYRWPTGRIDVRGELITIHDRPTHPNDPPVVSKMLWGVITNKHGSNNAQELVDYWLNHDFFLGGEVETSSTKYATKMTEVGDIKYVGRAEPESLQSSPVWSCQKMDKTISGEFIVTWADEGNFTQIATNLQSLTYQ